jgi:hypothetical protein
MIARRATLLLAVLIFPWPSLAYQIATDRNGRMLQWSDPGEIHFVVYPPAAPSASLPPNDVLIEAIREAVRSWNGIDGSAIRIRLEVAPPGRRPPKPGYDRDAPERNVNAILFETERWRHEPGAFAVTLRTYGSRSGELLDADIVFNAVQYRWDVLDGRTPRDPDGMGPVDVQGVATHEMGHALGFEHTQTRPSTMRANVGYGEVWMREISEVDAEGARFLYPATGEHGPPDEPREGEVVLTDAAAVAGCSTAHAGGDARVPPAAWLLVGAVAFLVLGATLRVRRAPHRAAAVVCGGLALLLAGGLGLPGTPLRASPHGPGAFEAAVVGADRIAWGVVDDVTGRWEGDRIVSEISVTVDACLRGICAAVERFHQEGGTVGEVAQAVVGEAAVQVGDEVVVLLADGDGDPTPMPRYGVLGVRRDGDGGVVGFVAGSAPHAEDVDPARLSRVLSPRPVPSY